MRVSAGPAFIPDRVEVICNENPEPRLEHWFSHDDSASIEDRLGLNTTCVIIFEHAQAELDTAGTDRLTYLAPLWLCATDPKRLVPALLQATHFWDFPAQR